MVNTRNTEPRSTDVRFDELQKGMQALQNEIARRNEEHEREFREIARRSEDNDKEVRAMRKDQERILDLLEQQVFGKNARKEDGSSSSQAQEQDSALRTAARAAEEANPGETPPTSHTTTPSLAFPTFDGTDALGWLGRADQFFMVHKTDPSQRMDLAFIALAGPALPWVQILRRREPNIPWESFTQELLIRFGDDTARDGYEALASTRQHGSLADYIVAFEAQLAQLPDLTDRQFLGFFLAGLRPQLHMQLHDTGITRYSDAVRMAKRLHWTAKGAYGGGKVTSGQTHNPGRSGQLYTPNTTPAKPTLSGNSTGSIGNSRTLRHFRQIPPEEYRKHIAGGTCFRFGQQFSPTHRCPPAHLASPHSGRGGHGRGGRAPTRHRRPFEDTERELQAIHLSELSSFGIDSFHTMQLQGYIRNKDARQGR